MTQGEANASGDAREVLGAGNGGAAVRKSRLRDRLILGGLTLAILWFQAWTAWTSEADLRYGDEQSDYYNLLIDGWLDGQLHLKVKVPEALLALQNPYDPAQRPPDLGLHDASFYKGKYYLYFGAAPVALLMLPARLIAGSDLPLFIAVLVFTSGGFLASLALWRGVRRRYFPDAGVVVASAGVLVLGLAALGPVLLRRPQVWELPIAAGYCFSMLALGCVWRSLHLTRGRAIWFGGAGLSLGLAIASRPTYLLAAPLLAVPLAWWWRETRRPPWRPAVAALVPLACIGALMALHNYLRFDDPLQFGQAYQFSLDYESQVTHFSPRYLPFNTWRYFFSVAQWSPYFPFIAPAELPPKPPGFSGHDDVYGILVNLPFAWLALAAPLALRRRTGSGRGELGAWLGALALLFAVMAGALLCFFGSLARYQIDFTPALMLLACVGLLAIERELRPMRAPARGAVRIGIAVTIGWSVLFGVLFSLQLDGLLREDNPAKEREVARALNRVVAAFERVIGAKHGAIEFTLRPAPLADGGQVLLSVGSDSRQDRVLLRPAGADRVQFVVQQDGAPEIASRPVRLEAGRDHAIGVTLGALSPPATHPLFDGRAPAEIRDMTRRVRIALDGERLIDERRAPMAASRRLRLGADAAMNSGTRFTGELRDFRRVMAYRSPDSRAEGAIRMRVTFPERPTSPREPLLAAADASPAAVLFVQYLAEGGRLAFGSSAGGEHRGGSDPIAIDVRRVHDVHARWFPGSTPGRRLVELRVNGVIAWSGELRWPERAGGVVVGSNAGNEPGCAPTFSGTVHQEQRSLDGRDPLLGPGDALRLHVQLPRGRVGSRDPLIVTGQPGAGDLVIIEYLTEDSVRFMLDHWSAGSWTSDPVAIDFGRPHQLEIALSSLADRDDAPARPATEPGRVRVAVDGAQVWDQRIEVYTIGPEEFTVGRNPIGGTSCGPVFTGDILQAERINR